MWTESIAVGSKKFVEGTKEVLVRKSKGKELGGEEKDIPVQRTCSPLYGQFWPPK